MIYLKKQPPSSSNQSGFTIIESLVAIIVVGILMTAIAPTIILSVATRVQARRVELAVDAAQSYIDGVRTSTIDDSDLPNSTELQDFDAPRQGNLVCNNHNKYCTSSNHTKLYCIDGDGDGKCTKTSSRDMIIQAFRYNKESDDAEDGYSLGVRVYRADAFDSNKVDELKALKDNGAEKQSTFTGGTGLRSVQTPLMEISTEISNSAEFSDFCKRLENTTNTTSDC